MESGRNAQPGRWMLLIVLAIAVAGTTCRKDKDTASNHATGTTTPEVDSDATTPSDAADDPTGHAQAATGPGTTTDAKRGGAAASPEVAEALSAIEAAWNKTTSFSAKVRTRLASAIGRPGKTLGKGTYDLLKDDGKLKIRFFIENVMAIILEPEKTGSDEIHTAERLTWTTDGTVMFQYTFQHKLHRVRKTWCSDADVLQLGGRPLLDELRDKRSVKRLDDDVLDADPVFVFEAKPQDGTWTEKHYFQKATGIRVQYVETDPSGEEIFWMKVSDVETGVEFEPDHFTFEVPEYAELIDETKP